MQQSSLIEYSIIKKLMQNKINIKSLVLLISIICFCFFMTISNSMFSNNIDEAIIISEKILIPDPIAPQLERFIESKAL